MSHHHSNSVLHDDMMTLGKEVTRGKSPLLEPHPLRCAIVVPLHVTNLRHELRRRQAQDLAGVCVCVRERERERESKCDPAQ